MSAVQQIIAGTITLVIAYLILKPGAVNSIKALASGYRDAVVALQGG